MRSRCRGCRNEFFSRQEAVSRGEAFFQRVWDSVVRGFDIDVNMDVQNHLSTSIAMSRAWTVPKHEACFDNQEFSTLLNDAIRHDDELVHFAVPIMRTMSYYVWHMCDLSSFFGEGKCGNETRVFRGSQIPACRLPWWTEGKRYRAAMALSASTSERIAKLFATRCGTPSGMLPVLFSFRCGNGQAIWLKEISKVQEEREILFLPYSAFTVESVTYESHLDIIVISVVAMEDSEAPEDIEICLWH
jgi:hypothetical protein